MNRLVAYLGAAGIVLAIACARPATAQTPKPFADVPAGHWAYQAVTDLQSKGILLGYPDGYFRGPRVLTRYEFAVALERALNTIMPGGQGAAGPVGPAGAEGPAGPTGPPGVTPEEIAEMQRLADEFKNELSSLGANVRDENDRLNRLAKDVADLRGRLNRMISFGGDFFAGFRSDRSRFAFLDYSGSVRAAGNSLFENVSAPHDFHLTVNGSLHGGARFTGDLFASNYASYTAVQGAAILGGETAANRNPLGEQLGIYQAQLDIPLTRLGSDTLLTVGRFKNRLTPLTYWRPNTDAYFNLPWYSDGSYVEDGVEMQSHLGPTHLKLWAGTYSDLTTSSGAGSAVLNAPMVGALIQGFDFGTRVSNTAKPAGLNPALVSGAIPAQQSVGAHLAVNLMRAGALGFTIEDFSAGPGGGNGVFGNVVVYGADVKLHRIGRIGISAEGAKSVTQADVSTGDGQSNDDNNAWRLRAEYKSHGLGAAAGYQYVDPRFGAPGYWDKIGNWYNPTNIAGPFLRLSYKFTPAISGYIGGDLLSGARNRSNPSPTGFGGAGLSIADSIDRARAGVQWSVNKVVSLHADYEGVFWGLTPASSASGAPSHPIEQYLTFGTGLNLASNTVLKLAYQLISLRDNGGGFAGAGGSPDGVSNASVLTTQVAIHF
ncbi:MAG: S-layer homology domain-containing protein [Armatimonadetes bacterium]|nr:S-layer homology domain-containing protein [Armatimonadota bacterium]MDE2205616.1 S-layer homology domain-containing protein [Armatimonadota bacterium]